MTTTRHDELAHNALEDARALARQAQERRGPLATREEEAG